jgi:integrase
LCLLGFLEVQGLTVSKSVSGKAHFRVIADNSIALAHYTLTGNAKVHLTSITDMKNRYRKFRRKAVWWCHDAETGKQHSLSTRDKREAIRIIDAKNQPYSVAGFHLEMARTNLQMSDAKKIQRTWQEVMDRVIATKEGKTRIRWERATKDKALDAIRNMAVVETKAETLLAVMDNGTVSTNVFLRRLHNFASDMNWLFEPVIPKRAWPRVEFAEKRAITLDEHRRIIERETNPERKAFYEVCWHVGGSQSDMAELTAANIDWQNRTLTYFRKKTRQKAQMDIGQELEKVLRSLPQAGPLFPYLAGVRECDRATEFKQRCKGLGISGVTLHSYRYSWAERAKTVGYPERYAQQALGQSSKAVHRAYAKNAEVKLPSLEEYERAMREKVVPLPAVAA